MPARGLEQLPTSFPLCPSYFFSQVLDLTFSRSLLFSCYFSLSLGLSQSVCLSLSLPLSPTKLSPVLMGLWMVGLALSTGDQVPSLLCTESSLLAQTQSLEFHETLGIAST